MQVLDPGHKYRLATLDGDVDVELTFVKRNSPPEKYPGNTSAYPGTTLQEVLRACLNRVRYVNNQIEAEENDDVVANLRLALASLEARAARLHSRPEPTSLNQVEFGPFCTVCGHVGHQCTNK